VRPFALRPFIDADDLRAREGQSGALLQPAHNRVVTDRHAEAATQSFTRPSAEGVAHQLDDEVCPTGSTAIDVGDLRQWPGKKTNRAAGLAAAPATDAHAQ
jgi:hypothetical protein